MEISVRPKVGLLIMSLLILPFHLNHQFKNLLTTIDPGFANICKVYLTLNEVLENLIEEHIKKVYRA